MAKTVEFYFWPVNLQEVQAELPETCSGRLENEDEILCDGVLMICGSPLGLSLLCCMPVCLPAAHV